MDLFDKKFKEIFSSQIISIIGGIIAGLLLAYYTDKIFLIPGLLILLPGFLEMRGNISGSMSARLTSGMYLGFINPKKTSTKIVKGNLFASFMLATIISTSLGLLAFVFNLFFGIYYPQIIFISLIAGIIANAMEIPLAMFLTFYLFKKGYDPDDVIGPFIDSTGDIISIVSLLIVILLI